MTRRIAIRLLLPACGLALLALANAATARDPEPRLEALNWDKFESLLKSPGSARYTLVDAWASTCGPCKENFPHLLEMHKKYASKGLRVISVSLDDPSDKNAVEDARKFLKSKNAQITNILLDEEFGQGFEKLKITAIPAVFVFGADGKEIKRFTLDDPNNQFTYDEVEKAVAGLLDTKS